MAVALCWDNSFRIQKPRIVLPSSYPRPYCSWNARFSGHRRASLIVRSQVRMEDVVEIAHNKVLMAAAVSGAIGQLAKPFTRLFLKGKKEEEKTLGFDLRAAIESGGFPSSHSSAVMATATSLLLERGFSDSIFGLSVIYAAIVMYDAQGVRREVGKHARVLNKKHRKNSVHASLPPINSSTTTLSDKNSRSPSSSSVSVERQAGVVSVLMADEKGVAAAATEELEEEIIMTGLLKEGVGHTKLEVVAGALLGISVSLFIYNLV